MSSGHWLTRCGTWQILKIFGGKGVVNEEGMGMDEDVAIPPYLDYLYLCVDLSLAFPSTARAVLLLWLVACE